MDMEIRHLRDHQEVIACTEKDDICDYFDQVLDSLEALRRKIY